MGESIFVWIGVAIIGLIIVVISVLNSKTIKPKLNKMQLEDALRVGHEYLELESKEYLKDKPEWSSVRGTYIGKQNTPVLLKEKAKIGSQYIVKAAYAALGELERVFGYLAPSVKGELASGVSRGYLHLLNFKIDSAQFPDEFIKQLLQPAASWNSYFLAATDNKGVVGVYLVSYTEEHLHLKSEASNEDREAIVWMSLVDNTAESMGISDDVSRSKLMSIYKDFYANLNGLLLDIIDPTDK